MITIVLYYSVAVVVLMQTAALNGRETMTIDIEAIVGDQRDGNVCPRMEKTANGIKKVRDSVKALLDEIAIKSECGDGLWYRVANLNMTDPSEQCPSAWREYNTSGIRACGRPVTSSGSRPATTYSTSHPYHKVCGRVVGYQVASPDAFHTRNNINQFYMDGISIMHSWVTS